MFQRRRRRRGTLGAGLKAPFNGEALGFVTTLSLFVLLVARMYLDSWRSG